MRACLPAIVGSIVLAGSAAWAQSPDASSSLSGLSPVILAVIAVILVALTAGIWRLAASVARCCSKDDKAIRGYLFSIAPDLLREGSGATFVLTRAGNFGRTPCILKETYLESVAAEPTGNQAIYQSGRLLKHDLVFDVNDQDVRLSEPALAIPGAANSYLVGYVRYLDVFGASHMTRYCYLVRPATASFERAGSAAWNQFD